MDINSYLVPGKRAHLAGIGGVSMSPLAEVLHSMGLSVQGSDMNDSPAVEHLRALGIPVAIGHAADNLGDADFVVRTRRHPRRQSRDLRRGRTRHPGL